MTVLLVSLSMLSALVLTATAISLYALYRAHLLVRELGSKRSEPAVENKTEVQDVRNAVEALAAQLHDWRKNPPVALEPSPGAARPGLNLSKRSQALRMHRTGENAAQIATKLELPKQEVDLLLKVHRIVLSNV